MKPILGLVAVVLAVAFFAVLQHRADTMLSKLDLQAETRTCHDALKSDIGTLVTVYCEGVIREHDAIVKAHKEEQLQKLLERVQEKG